MIRCYKKRTILFHTQRCIFALKNQHCDFVSWEMLPVVLFLCPKIYLLASAAWMTDYCNTISRLLNYMLSSINRDILNKLWDQWQEVVLQPLLVSRYSPFFSILRAYRFLFVVVVGCFTRNSNKNHELFLGAALVIKNQLEVYMFDRPWNL